MLPELDKHFFRHEYGNLVAALCRHFGGQHLAAAEDAAQSALMVAVETWPATGLPNNPSAWLYRVALNEATGVLRQAGRRREILEQAELHAPQHQSGTEGYEPPQALSQEVKDDLLRMLFVCCNETVVVEGQLVLALKVLCGFSVREIATRLFMSDANVYKRLERARARLRQAERGELELDPAAVAPRLGAVRQVLYLMFTEGHLSSHSELAIRRELCDEALRLSLVLAEHPVGRQPETDALVALMLLHGARLSARQDPSGELLLLAEQDRSAWNAEMIAEGLGWLGRSAAGQQVSRFHAEAAIAAEHCLAPSFEATRWERVAAHYQLLEQLAPSPLHRLGRALAVAEFAGPEQGLELLNGFPPPTWLSGSYIWATALADLYRRCGRLQEAEDLQRTAIRLAPSPAVEASIERRLGISTCDNHR